MLDAITPLILTWNEEANIGRVLDRLAWSKEIVVVDSGSTDKTLEILSGYPNVRVMSRKFDSHAKQWNFGLQECGITSEWVLALDADYVLDEACVAGLGKMLNQSGISGCRAHFYFCVNGQALRGTLYPPVTVLYRRSEAQYIQDGHTQRVQIRGEVSDLPGHILHDDRKSLSQWLHAQARYASLEAGVLLQSRWSDLSWPRRLRRCHVIMPALMFFYCLIIKRGVLDGWAGLHYAFQRALAESIQSITLIEHRMANKKPDQKK